LFPLHLELRASQQFVDDLCVVGTVDADERRATQQRLGNGPRVSTEKGHPRRARRRLEAATQKGLRIARQGVGLLQHNPTQLRGGLGPAGKDAESLSHVSQAAVRRAVNVKHLVAFQSQSKEEGFPASRGADADEVARRLSLYLLVQGAPHLGVSYDVAHICRRHRIIQGRIEHRTDFLPADLFRLMGLSNGTPAFILSALNISVK